MKTTIGAFGSAFAGEHTRGIFIRALKRKYARGKRKASRQIFSVYPSQQVPGVRKPRQRNPRNGCSGKALVIQYRVNFLTPDGIHHFILHVLVAYDGDALQYAPALGGQVLFQLRTFFFQYVAGFTIAMTQQGYRAFQPPDTFNNLGLFSGFFMIAADCIRNLGKIANTVSGDDDGFRGRNLLVCFRTGGLPSAMSAFIHCINNGLIQGRHAVIVESCRNGTEYGNIFGGGIKEMMITLVLFAHIA
ncbi:MAG: hypothetical protein BWX80_00163 [Candidatus Hydrogenedentes bacterium ADurb.Bin101]|nr:MAG: hypothetical protein BWX80_00163 [Candidatus Hydrogenedentes bacterium ADurb.Bin101]